MNRQSILQLTSEFSENSPTNYLSPKAEDEETLNRLANNFNNNNYARNNLHTPGADGTVLNFGKDERYVGMRFFTPPILSVGSAFDEGFLKLKEPGVVGPHHLMPQDWLPEAKSVISLFLPFTERVIASNTADPKEPSMEWLFTRVDGQQHLLSIGAHVRDSLIQEGYKAVVPYTEDRYIMRTSHDQTDLPIPAYSSNWSERHVAYIRASARSAARRILSQAAAPAVAWSVSSPTGKPSRTTKLTKLSTIIVPNAAFVTATARPVPFRKTARISTSARLTCAYSAKNSRRAMAAENVSRVSPAQHEA